MSRRRPRSVRAVSVLAALAPAALLPLSSAAAEPFAGRILRGTATIVVDGTDGVRRTLEIVAEDASGTGEVSYLQVTVAVCTQTECTEGATYGKVLDPTEFEAAPDGSSAAVRTRFAGGLVSITWTRPQSTVNVVADVAAPDRVAAGNQTDATVSASLFGFSCSVYGELADVAQVSSDHTAPGFGPEPKRLPRGFSPKGRQRLTCAA